MRAVVAGRHGGPEVLELVERDSPEPGPGQILVEVAASGVNYIDVYHRTGVYPTVPPFVLGLEGAGTVLAVGDGVTEPAVGDLVAWTGVPGGYAERVVLPAGRAVRVPTGVTAEDAAGAMLQGITAQYLTHSTYPVQPGDTVLVHAAAGGVGLLLIQMVKARGGRVIGTVSTAAKEELARQAGADEVIRYTEVDFAERTRELTDGAGVAVVYDGVGRTTFDGSLASLRPRGMMALYGQASGAVPPLDLQRLNDHGSLFVTRPSLVHHIATDAELHDRADAVLGAIAAGRLTIRIGHRYPLAEAATAHADLEGRRTTGKLLLLPN